MLRVPPYTSPNVRSQCIEQNKLEVYTSVPYVIATTKIKVKIIFYNFLIVKTFKIP